MAKVTEFAQQSFLEELACPDVKVETRKLSIGATLRTARRKRGATSVKNIAAEICAWPYHVKAIENDQFDLLPGTTYAIGYIRAYANYLGLDGSALVQRFKDEMAPEPPALKENNLGSFDSPHLPTWVTAATVLVLLVGAYVTWRGLFSETMPPAPVALASSSPAFVDDAAPPVEKMPPLALVAQPPMALARNPAVVPSRVAEEHHVRRHRRRASVSKEAPAAAKTLPSGQKSVDVLKPVRLRSISYTRHAAPVHDAPVGTFDLLVRNTAVAPVIGDDGMRHQVSFDPAAFLNHREPVVP